MTQRNDCKIIKAEGKHAQDIFELELECFSHPWSKSEIEKSLSNENAVFLLAQIKEKAVAYIGFYSVLDEAYMYNLAVKSRYRRQGIAERLLRKAIDILCKRAVCFLSLEVRASNLSAIGLYEKLDFELAGRRRGFYRTPTEDALIMTKYFNKGV